MFDPQAEARRWLAQAERDIEAAEHSRKGGYYDVACFLSQQAAEKALKSFLYGQGQHSVLGHSAVELGQRCASIESTFSRLAHHFARLDRLYIPTRYPNGLPGGCPFEVFLDDDAVKALSDAREVIEQVKQRS